MRKFSLGFIVALIILFVISRVQTASGADWTVSVTLHEVKSLSDDDASGGDDFYFKASISPTIGLGSTNNCNTFRDHTHDNNNIFPDWVCTSNVSGGPDTTVQIVMQIWDHDTTSEDDHFDIHNHPSVSDIVIGFKPGTQNITIENLAGWETPRCAAGKITLEGLHGDDRAKVVFSLSGDLVGSPVGDADNDGLQNSWELCGMDNDGDGSLEVDLPAMGANLYRKDLFVEIDWMVDNDGAAPTDHSHEPWLPAMINAWNEFNVAPVTNPTVDGVITRSGINLHIDVGTLYAGYNVDFNGDGTAEINVDASGNLDLNSPADGIPDIGNLGALGVGTVGGGNQIAEDPSLASAPGPGGTFFNSGSDFANIKAANFNSIRDSVFRYAVFAHNYPSMPPNSSGRAECAGPPPCNDFFVTFGSPPWGRQTLDTNGDGNPDTTLDTDGDGVLDPLDIDGDGVADAGLLLGPTGLPVDGTIAQHAGTFKHELGHTLALGHGGGDGTNWKPNYLSIMSYTWQLNGLTFDFDGDLLTDPVGLDYNNDTIIDNTRFIYSITALPNLSEAIPPGLNENIGIGDGVNLTNYSCPAPVPGGNRVGAGTGAIDWNCDGDSTDNPASVDINNADGALTNLPGFNDYNAIANGGLVFQPSVPGISPEELKDFQSKTTRIIQLPNENFLSDRCETLRTITFEEFPRGTNVENQYAPPAVFLKDALRTPIIIGPEERSGLPTKSPSKSLLNRFVSNPAPLVISFGTPQRFVALFLGWQRPGAPEDNFAILKAYDVNNNPMGEVRRPLPDFTQGITAFFGVGAIFADQLIGRIELSYGGAASSEPVQIDDLILCEKKKAGTTTPSFPRQPSFGDLQVTVQVDARDVGRGLGGDGELGHSWSYTETPLAGVPIESDGMVANTSFSVTKQEGESVTFVAPATFGASRAGDLNFLHWRLNDRVFFGEEETELTLTLLSNGTLTAVYEREGQQDRPNLIWIIPLIIVVIIMFIGSIFVLRRRGRAR